MKPRSIRYLAAGTFLIVSSSLSSLLSAFFISIAAIAPLLSLHIHRPCITKTRTCRTRCKGNQNMRKRERVRKSEGGGWGEGGSRVSCRAICLMVENLTPSSYFIMSHIRYEKRIRVSLKCRKEYSPYYNECEYLLIEITSSTRFVTFAREHPITFLSNNR